MSTAAIPHLGPGEPPALLFDEGRRTRSHWRLGLLIFLSLLAHAASFYVLQVAYTPTASLLPPPARVILVPLDRPENASLAHWLSLADPALSAQSPAPTADAVLDSLGFRYVPSYATMPPAFKSLDAVTPAEGIAAPPRPLPLGPVVLTAASAGRTGLPNENRNGPALGPTRVILAGGIDALAPRPLPPVHFAGGPAIKPLEPTVFLVGVRPEGGMPLLFPMRQALANNASANADEADELARDYLARLMFRPAHAGDGGAVWGRATFYWGDDSRQEEK